MKAHYRPKFSRTARKAAQAVAAVARVNVLTKIIPVTFRRCFRVDEVNGEKVTVRVHRKRTVGVRTNYGAVMREAAV